MRRSTWAGLLAIVLVLGMSVAAARAPVPYVTFAPGPTVNVLGKSGKTDIIAVSGRTSYRDKGGLRLVTVVPSGPANKVNLLALVSAWLDPDRAVYPYEAIYPTTATQKSVRQESTQQMASSQDLAVAAALGALKITFSTGVQVSQVDKDGPAEGKLRVGDVLTRVDGERVRSLEELTTAVRSKPVGTEVSVELERKSTRLTRVLKTTKSAADPQDSAFRIGIQSCCFDFPFEVDLNIAENIGGPSGGLMFALGIYDVLTPGSLTAGKVIAGTGEIDAEGNVGEIGGIQQKLVGAQEDGATLFLVPAGNCAEALDGNYDPEKMRLVKVNTLAAAIKDVQAWVKDPDTKLTRCTA